MTMYVSFEKHQGLEMSKLLHKWLCLVGQLNWVFNRYLWLRPTLGAMYAKTVGKMPMWGKVKINQAVQCKLMWFIEHVQSSDGIFFFDPMV